MTLSTPLVSIIIPSYNHARYIGNAIESVLAQTYPNIELIVVDDGSKDNSHDVIRSYAEKDPRIVAILNEQNRGQSYVFNRALEVAKGEFVSLLPSDDWYLPRKTEAQVAKFLASPDSVGVVYCRGQRFFEDTGEYRDVKLPVYTGWVADKFITWGPFVYPVTPLFRRAVFDKAPMDERYKAEGEAVYIRIAIHYQFEFVDEVLAVMRDHTYNIGKNVDVMYDEVYAYWEDFFRRPEVPQHLRALRKQRMERLHRVKGMQFIGERRNFAKGRQCLWRAVKEKPALLLQPKFAAALSLSHMPATVANLVLDRLGKGNGSAGVSDTGA